MSARSRPVRTLLAYHYFPAYRRAVVQCLAAHEALDIHVLYGTNTGSVRIDVLDERDFSAAGIRPDHIMAAKNIWLFGLLLWQSRIVLEVLLSRYDVVILLGDYRVLSYWLAMIVCRMRRVPVLLWTHGVRGEESGIRAQVRRAFYRLSSGLLLYGDRARELLQSSGLARLPMWVIGNSLDYATQSSLRRQDASSVGRRNLVYLGRLEPGKSLDLLLDAMDGLTDLPIELHVLGGGSLQRELEERALALRLQNVVFHGRSFDEEHIASILNEAFATVVPGDAGLTVVHSLTYGVPVVTHSRLDTHGPEVEAVWGTDMATLFEPGDVDGLRRAIRRRYCSKLDVSALCIETVGSKYTPAAQCDAIVAALDQARQQA